MIAYAWALQQVGKGYSRKKVLQVFAEIGPQVVGEAGVALLAVTPAIAAGHIYTLVHRFDDLSDIDLTERPAQPIAPAGATCAGNQASASQAGKQLLEIGQGQFLPRGDIRKSQRAGSCVQGKIEHGCHGIAPASGELHGYVRLAGVRFGRQYSQYPSTLVN